ncbi:GH92 family glycosyl hydrolase, partial [Psychroserpens sp.]|uniref:GH92 family glycosyl hydrolase n=1 Tax=Psychroserpens sp. TaxID=2020870 RepID=UPI003C75E7DC
NGHTSTNSEIKKHGYGSHFSHEKEVAQPGYYGVHLDDTNIDVGLTVSKRSGMHRYDFPLESEQFVILDLAHRDELLDYRIQCINDSTLVGFRHSKAWANDQRLFYAIQFSRPIKSITYQENGTAIAKNYKFQSTVAAIEFDKSSTTSLLVKVAISAVDSDGALNNLKEEIGQNNFDEQRKEAQVVWEQQLQKIVIKSNSIDYKTNFYTALYHTMLAPNLYQDVDGRYRGMDLEIHQTTDFDYYSVFSLWDTYRAAHPLYTIIEQDRTNNFINTFLAKFDEGGIMPIWDLSANYTGCMIGYHAVPVIADAYLKGIKNYDTEKAFQAMKHSATRDHLGLKSYKELGFIPVEAESESVSKTLEYAYDDWTIAQMAKAMNKTKDYKTYLERAQFYKNVYDPKSKFMRGRFRNTWFAPFDPYEVNYNYTEANAWQYSFYVPQDVSGFMDLLGGKAQLEAQLDELFTAEYKTSGRNQADITGLIGQYAHGNEPSHHMAYLYNFANAPHKTQEKVHQILTELYTNTPNGISGNEDCGQMSAWYVFSSMGFYPVTPGSNHYIIGTPLFEMATINLESGKQFTITAKNLSDKNKYIEAAFLNGNALDRTYITHEDIIAGGTLAFEMTNKPAIWGSRDDQEPITKINDHLIVPAPFIEKGQVAFKGETEISLGTVAKQSEIFYSLNDSKFQLYSTPFKISEATTLSVYASNLSKQKSATVTTTFYKIDPNLAITLETDYANQYNAGGNDALIDGVLGTPDFRTGTWQGYQDTDLMATVDLGEARAVNSIEINFLQDQRSWIFYPTQVQCLTSTDGEHFKLIDTMNIDAAIEDEKTIIKNISFNLPIREYRYIKLIAKKMGKLPAWHIGNEQDGRSWIFADEIIIKYGH